MSDTDWADPDGSARAWPVGHSAWVFRGTAEFEGRAATFLAQGLERNERLLFVADDPRRHHWPTRLLDDGVLQLASVSEVYGTDHLIDADEQRATFTAVLAEALRAGFSGVRVVADNTRLISTPEQLDAWSAWEEEADRFMADHPVTGLCGFDRTRAVPSALEEVVALHASVVAGG